MANDDTRRNSMSDQSSSTDQPTYEKPQIELIDEGELALREYH